MSVLYAKHRKLQRIRELTEWARRDYGIEINTKNKGSHLTEAEFILKVKEKYINKRNNEAALKLQSLYRGFVVRARYRKYRDYAVSMVTRLQCFVRMRLARRRFLDLLYWWQGSAALTI
jgi:hypothetical protein